eukprot:TRINITY_DN7396_c0_g1_i18.p1 TRINITY_DN7396_c0_g1~~TRINITY_DN7396_c0_g1_i18.p1  ORF type:complete len:188 (-),score=30.92 TRINITY_DN7396_c0_g1_i18:16-579(-)
MAVLLLLCLLALVHCYHDGAPTYVCELGQPHHNQSPASSVPADFKLEVKKKDDQTVTVNASTSTAFKGFFYRVKRTDKGTPAFSLPSQTGVHSVDCADKGFFGVTHDNTDLKSGKATDGTVTVFSVDVITGGGDFELHPTIVTAFSDWYQPPVVAFSTGSSKLETKKEIGRAVQQECRDRSRMPSSA